MNTTQLECFLAVAEQLNFARAAEELHITQPAVTHQIASLEEELGTRLFTRTTRLVRLTDDGISFIADARNILSTALGAKHRLATRRTDRIQRLVIGCQSFLELDFLSGALRELKTKFPQVHPDLRFVPSISFQDLLDDESIDVIPAFRPEHAKREPGEFFPLCEAKVACLVAPDHPLADRSLVSLKDLQTGNMIICEPRRQPASLVRVQGKIIGYHPPQELYFTENPACTVTLAKAGIGFALLPDFGRIRNPELVYIPVEDTDSSTFGLYYKTKKDRPVLQAFLEITKRCFLEGNNYPQYAAFGSKSPS